VPPLSAVPPRSEPVVTEIRDAAATPTAAPAVDAGSAVADEPAPTVPAKATAAKRGHRDRRRDESGPTEAGELSPARVQASFRSVQREYEQFKKRYGARLDAEWNDLANLATFAQGPDKLPAIDRDIQRFRGKMRAVREADGR
jgi:hypothetical protein